MKSKNRIVIIIILIILSISVLYFYKYNNINKEKFTSITDHLTELISTNNNHVDLSPDIQTELSNRQCAVYYTDDNNRQNCDNDFLNLPDNVLTYYAKNGGPGGDAGFYTNIQKYKKNKLNATNGTCRIDFPKWQELDIKAPADPLYKFSYKENSSNPPPRTWAYCFNQNIGSQIDTDNYANNKYSLDNSYTIISKNVPQSTTTNFTQQNFGADSSQTIGFNTLKFNNIKEFVCNQPAIQIPNMKTSFMRILFDSNINIVSLDFVNLGSDGRFKPNDSVKETILQSLFSTVLKGTSLFIEPLKFTGQCYTFRFDVCGRVSGLVNDKPRQLNISMGDVSKSTLKDHSSALFFGIPDDNLIYSYDEPYNGYSINPASLNDLNNPNTSGYDTTQYGYQVIKNELNTVYDNIIDKTFNTQIIGSKSLNNIDLSLISFDGYLYIYIGDFGGNTSGFQLSGSSLDQDPVNFGAVQQVITSEIDIINNVKSNLILQSPVIQSGQIYSTPVQYSIVFCISINSFNTNNVYTYNNERNIFSFGVPGNANDKSTGDMTPGVFLRTVNGTVYIDFYQKCQKRTTPFTMALPTPPSTQILCKITAVNAGDNNTTILSLDTFNSQIADDMFVLNYSANDPSDGRIPNGTQIIGLNSGANQITVNKIITPANIGKQISITGGVKEGKYFTVGAVVNMGVEFDSQNNPKYDQYVKLYYNGKMMKKEQLDMNDSFIWGNTDSKQLYLNTFVSMYNIQTPKPTVTTSSNNSTIYLNNLTWYNSALNDEDMAHEDKIICATRQRIGCTTMYKNMQDSVGFNQIVSANYYDPNAEQNNDSACGWTSVTPAYTEYPNMDVMNISNYQIGQPIKQNKRDAKETCLSTKGCNSFTRNEANNQTILENVFSLQTIQMPSQEGSRSTPTTSAYLNSLPGIQAMSPRALGWASQNKTAYDTYHLISDIINYSKQNNLTQEQFAAFSYIYLINAYYSKDYDSYHPNIANMINKVKSLSVDQASGYQTNNGLLSYSNPPFP